MSAHIHSIVASIGFVFAVMTFIAGFRMVRKTDHAEEILLHRVNGYLTVIMYLLLAGMSILKNYSLFYVIAWCLGLSIHLLKILLARKGLAVRYGGYMGGMLIATWLVVIFTHLPS